MRGAGRCSHEKSIFEVKGAKWIVATCLYRLAATVLEVDAKGKRARSVPFRLQGLGLPLGLRAGILRKAINVTSA